MDFFLSWCIVCGRRIQNPDGLYCSSSCQIRDFLLAPESDFAAATPDNDDDEHLDFDHDHFQSHSLHGCSQHSSSDDEDSH
ncbi:hypothetical protein HK102_001770, partial [Quaeritorhiza haematococci]